MIKSAQNIKHVLKSSDRMESQSEAEKKKSYTICFYVNSANSDCPKSADWHTLSATIFNSSRLQIRAKI